MAVVMAFLLVISTSLWLYNLLDLRKEVEDEVVNVIESLGPVRCKDCVEFLPNYSALFASVVCISFRCLIRLLCISSHWDY